MGMEFDRTDDYINCSSGASIADIFSGGGSVAFWMYAENIDGTAQSFMGTQAATSGWTLEAEDVAGDKIRFFQLWDGAGDRLNAWTAPSTGAWHHIAFTHNQDSTANVPKLFIDGSSVTPVSSVGPAGSVIGDAGSPLQIGNVPQGSKLFGGKMEDCRAVRRRITSKEAALLAAGYRGPLDSEVVWLDMEGVDAQVASSGYASVMDKTVYKHHGTPQGALVYIASKAERYG